MMFFLLLKDKDYRNFMGSQKENINKSNLENIVVLELSPFFDLLARFDYEDKQKEKSVINSDLLVSAPKRPALNSDYLE